MKPTDTGHLYDQIAAWWYYQQKHSTTGIPFVQMAVRLSANKDKALDVGCGSGRIVATLQEAGFHVTGIDVSEVMVEYARKRHSDSDFLHVDICEWEPRERYDTIIAWDSIFHVPYSAQRRVIGTLCDALASGGVILFTAGGVDGEITGQMCSYDFYYSSLSEEEYLQRFASGCDLIATMLKPVSNVVLGDGGKRVS
jgi:SAM-dependent methyltransferase